MYDMTDKLAPEHVRTDDQRLTLGTDFLRGKTKSACAMKRPKEHGPSERGPYNSSALLGADGSLDFRFVDVEIGVDVLHVIVLFEGFD